MIIAIDGEASTGKSTQAKKIAKELNIDYKDSGAYYRAITLFLIRNQINSREKLDNDLLSKIHISQKFKNDIFSIFLNGEDVTSKIRGHKVSISVSEYAKKPEIRKFVYNLLRKSSKLSSIIIDGRDIGTVVFPDADYKFFLYANPEIRAKRRHKEINDESVKIESIEREIRERDNKDSTRDIAPLKKAEDAHVIDVGYLTIDQVFEEILEKIIY
ncbi:MAG: (d)CMP kinase [Bacteroidetes bacterium]|nr:(d)CMP kinase [Cryomorphaceae bacterium]MDA0330362.1 (d)CMP kinase [Bacteroidota bacterium]MDA1225960.1 (d)CMP kinase [Bacteroidota bacterium]